jgi:Fic family protein
MLGILNEPFFGNEMSHSVTQQLKKIDTEKVVLDAARPLSETTMRMLHENIMLEWIYHSNGMEGSSMSWSETRVVLQGLTPKHKTHKEFYEVVNHRDAIEYLVDMVRKNESVTEYQIRNIHSILLKNINPEIAGCYREKDVIIFGAETDPPEFIHVPYLMNALIDWYQQAGAMHPVERAAILHTRFVMIHPFLDNNGRTGRLLMNLELMKYGYPPAVIQITDRPHYYEAIEAACASNNYDMIISHIAEAVQKTLKVYLRVL